MSVPNPANSAEQVAAATNTPLPTEPHERRREAGISKAGTAPDSVGNPSLDQTFCLQVWHCRLAFTPVLLLLTLPLASFATELPASSKRGAFGKLHWYFQSKQWIADARTFHAACQFLLDAQLNERLADDH